MFDNGIIEKLPNPHTTHIRVPGYDQLVGRDKREAACNEAGGVTFGAFWKKYHEVTQRQRINIGRARREWKKLSAHERNTALAKIDEYYDNLKDIKYCKQAASYLADKTFLDEYDY